MTTHASGPFDVQVIPQAQDVAEGSALGRLVIEKQFHGDLQATGKGEMLSANMETGAAIYVAVERVSGTLHGRSGTFVLVHNGVMTGDGQQLSIVVAPDSGTGELAGLTGTLAITNVEGKHSYDFAYTLPESP